MITRRMLLEACACGGMLVQDGRTAIVAGVSGQDGMMLPCSFNDIIYIQITFFGSGRPYQTGFVCIHHMTDVYKRQVQSPRKVTLRFPIPPSKKKYQTKNGQNFLFCPPCSLSNILRERHSDHTDRSLRVYPTTVGFPVVPEDA